MANLSEDDVVFCMERVEQETLATAILFLSDSERLVLTLYYYERLTTKELELLLGETKSGLSQIHASAWSQLHNRLAEMRARTPDGSELSMLSYGTSSDGAAVCGSSLDRLRVGPVQNIRITLWRNNELQDWSFEINGLRYEHVTSAILENMVEAALIVAQNWLMEPAARPQ